MHESIFTDRPLCKYDLEPLNFAVFSGLPFTYVIYIHGLRGSE